VDRRDQKAGSPGAARLRQTGDIIRRLVSRNPAGVATGRRDQSAGYARRSHLSRDRGRGFDSHRLHWHLRSRSAERLLYVRGTSARGRTNAEIADELGLAVGTVKTHVASILAKLGCRDRTQVVVLAYELGVVRPGG